MADTETKTPLEANGDTIAEIKTMVDELPEAGGGTDISLGITSAAVGDIVKVKAVDASGKPTEWEAAGGSAKYRQIIDFTVTELADSFQFTNDGAGFDMSNVSEVMFVFQRPEVGKISAVVYFSGVNMDGFTFANEENSVRTARLTYSLTSPMECEAVLYANSDYWWGTNAIARHLWHSKATMANQVSKITVENWKNLSVGTTIKGYVR